MPDVSRFTHRLRVRYAECDLQGVVFNARYLDYVDVGITEYFRQIGLKATGADMPEFHVVRAAVDFRAPIVADEEIDIGVTAKRIGASSLTFAIRLTGLDGGLRAESEIVYVHVDGPRGRSTPIPPALRTRFEAFEGRALGG